MKLCKFIGGILFLGAMLAAGPAASAAGPGVGLGTAASFGVLAGTAVTNVGATTIDGNVGVSPGAAVTGFPPGGTANGTVHSADAVASQAQTDLTIAYNDAAGRTGGATVSGDLGGRTLTPGVYTSASSLGLTGTLTLDAQGNPNAVFVFQAGSTLTTASGSHVNMIGGARACNVFWQLGSSGTLGTNSVFRGNVLALTSITVTTGTTVEGRVLSRNGAVTLDTDIITKGTCTTSPGGTAGTGGTTSPGGTTGTGGTGGTGGTTSPGGTTGTGGTGGTTSPRGTTGKVLPVTGAALPIGSTVALAVGLILIGLLSDLLGSPSTRLALTIGKLLAEAAAIVKR